MSRNNLFEAIPDTFTDELFEDLVAGGGVRVERILSQGHRSPASGWYDQNENEWVVVLQGAGKVVFEDGGEVLLSPGDYLNIPKNVKHRVAWTEPDAVTVWLAVFYP
ncbi:MAG: cupin domain-containing protein [Pseudomonadota bacterium]